MHSAKITKSDRLKRVLKVLRRGGAYSTRELIKQAKVCAVNSIVAELRDNGYRIGCKSMGSPRRWVYMLEGRA